MTFFLFFLLKEASLNKAQALLTPRLWDIKSWDGFHVPFSKLRYIQSRNNTHKKKKIKEGEKRGRKKNIIGILGHIYRHVLPLSTYNGYFVDNGSAILFKRIITRVRWQLDNGSYSSLHPSSVSGLPEWETLPLSVSPLSLPLSPSLPLSLQVGLSWRGKIRRFAKYLSACAPTRPAESNLDIKEWERVREREINWKLDE